jgi:hypothetical protein
MLMLELVYHAWAADRLTGMVWCQLSVTVRCPTGLPTSVLHSQEQRDAVVLISACISLHLGGQHGAARDAAVHKRDVWCAGTGKLKQ